MSGGYTVVRSGRTLEQGYRVWCVSNGYYVGGADAPAYATYDEAAAAAGAQEAADSVARKLAGLRTPRISSGRVYRR